MSADGAILADRMLETKNGISFFKSAIAEGYDCFWFGSAEPNPPQGWIIAPQEPRFNSQAVELGATRGKDFEILLNYEKHIWLLTIKSSSSHGGMLMKTAKETIINREDGYSYIRNNLCREMQTDKDILKKIALQKKGPAPKTTRPRGLNQ